MLTRDDYKCLIRGPYCAHKATEVHHTVGRGVTGDDMRYLISACHPCHAPIGDPTKHTPKPNVNQWWNK
ncbi:hypothetical protein FRP1_21950 [Pseudonocardia sp. EC080625-04]|nr:hypothetical protein FRP1_21950 [Pseudonocardia sp. EC080625-04]